LLEIGKLVKNLNITCFNYFSSGLLEHRQITF